jgi:hypothetical protein
LQVKRFDGELRVGASAAWCSHHAGAMGAVLLLVMLPGVFVLFLFNAVFDGAAAVLISTVILGAMGALLYAAREWDAPADGDRHAPERG